MYNWNICLITLDIDWVPDFIIDFVAEELLQKQVKATWFVTHLSPAVERLRQHPHLFELGIHPNFLPTSTHGRTAEDVLRHCMTLVPEAISMRTHGLVQSSPLLEQVMSMTPIKVDFSLFLPHVPHLIPFEYRVNGKAIWRVPYFWEDDFEAEQLRPCWRLAPLLKSGNGMKVFDFHPIHIYLNMAEKSAYQALKQCVPKLDQATPANTDPLINHGDGARTLFGELITYLSDQRKSFQAQDLVESLATSYQEKVL